MVQDLATQWIQAYRCKTKTSQETQRSLQSSWNPNPKVIYTDNSLEFGKACEDLSWNRCASTPHRSETNGIGARAVRRAKQGTSATWRANSVECCACPRNVTGVLSDGMTRRFGKPFKEPIIPFGSIGCVVTLFPRKTSQESINLEKSRTRTAPRIRSVRGCGNLEGDVLVEDIEELETMDASGKIIFWRGSGTENIHLGAASTSNSRFSVHVGKLHLPPLRWTTSQTLLAERRIIPYSTEIHWRIQNYSFGCQSRKNASMIIGISMGLETCLMRKQLTPRPDHLWPELWKSMGKHSKLKEKQKWSNEKFHPENERKLRGTHLTDPGNTEFKETIKNAREKLEMPMALAMPCKIAKNFGYGKFDTVSSWRPYCRKRWKFITALQHGSQIYSYASSYVNSGSESSCGQGMGKIGENSGEELD